MSAAPAEDLPSGRHPHRCQEAKKPCLPLDVKKINQICTNTLHRVADLGAKGAEAVILGCTEIGMLIGPADTSVALYDTTGLHAEKAVALALD